MISGEQAQELYDMIHTYQPGCLVSSRVGCSCGIGDYRTTLDNAVSDDNVDSELAESPSTLNNTWGYRSFDNNWKSPERIVEIREHLNSRGINYLLNAGPDYLGRIPGPSADILRTAGNIQSRYMKQHKI
jgi:alpha-L-fucosidase